MLCDCQGQVIKGDRVFSWLSLSLSGHLPLEPPCYEEAQSHGEAHVERNQGPGPSTPTELPANSLHQLASHVSEASWKWIFQPSVKPPQMTLGGEPRAFPAKPCPQCRLTKKKNCCFKPLGFGQVCYTVINNQNNSPITTTKYRTFLLPQKFTHVPSQSTTPQKLTAVLTYSPAHQFCLW